MKQTSRLLVSRWVFSRHGGQPSHPSPSSRVETAQKRWRSTFLTQKQRRITGFPRFSTSNDLSEQNLDRSQGNTDINSLKESFSSLEIAIPLPPEAIHDVKVDSNKTIPDTIETVMSDSALEGVGRGFHFVSPSQYQILIKSLGHVGGEEVDDAMAITREVAQTTSPFQLLLTRVGVFPSWNKPRELFVDLGRGRKHVKKLAEAVDEMFSATFRAFYNVDVTRKLPRKGKVLQSKDFSKSFSPRVVIGEWDNILSGSARDTAFRESCIGNSEIGEFRVDKISLVRRRGGGKSATREVLVDFPLAQHTAF